MNLNNCRLCLLDNNNNASIFTDFNERSNLAAKIMQIANVQVYEGDGLSNLVCKTCISKVESFVQFKSQIEKSDYFLRQQLNRFQVDPLSATMETNSNIIKAEFSPIRKELF
uniref:ZAD domain-containing protein n=1 Tax=Clastoptera arizonana TaxID=38151 RepID=A0A1B6DGE3_9HEMI